MKRLTIVLIPEDAASSKQISISQWMVKIVSTGSFLVALALGYVVLDYLELRSLRKTYVRISRENEGLKGEAKLLVSNLEEVKKSLKRVQDYAEKLGELTNLNVKRVSKQTGIGPLTPNEFSLAAKQPPLANEGPYFPLGIDAEKLVFRPVLDRLSSLDDEANRNAIELQQLLSTLSQQKSLLSSIPSVTPADGWITSGFGIRISPFTGERAMHYGIDVAAPIGTPIFAPADGVVIFSGLKDGFGNFTMIAHGYGVVSRYGHNAQNMVQPGQKVRRGDVIATIGMTGRTTGPHLHYEITVNGQPVNPKKFILELE